METLPLSFLFFVSDLLWFFLVFFPQGFWKLCSSHGNVVVVVKKKKVQLLCRLISAACSCSVLSRHQLFKIYPTLFSPPLQQPCATPGDASTTPPPSTLPLPHGGNKSPALCAILLPFSPEAWPPFLAAAFSPALDLLPMAKNIPQPYNGGKCLRASACPTFSLSKLGQARSSLGDYRTV